ncbi:type IV secretion system DNA-binding domain-containing protein [Streptomyces profundus]|nr:type IV secretion system DNA-binding domain-containing protein [Streptomyces sp. MA3_2.13]
MTDFLTDPLSFWRTAATTGRALIASHTPLLATATATGVATLVARPLLARRRAKVFARGARCVSIQAPPQVSDHGGELLWAQLSGLLRPWWHRLASGQPHIAFEYAWTHQGLNISLWTPSQVPIALARQAVEAAWPGAHTTVTDAAQPVPAGHTVTAGRLRLARPEVATLRTGHHVDPLRALLQAAAGLNDGERVIVQVLARPATGRRRRRVRRAARTLKTGHHHRFTPLRGMAAWAAHRPQPALEARQDADHHTAVRQAADKLTGPLWATSLTYAASTPPSNSAREAVRGRAHAIASAFGLFAARNWLVRTRLPHPHQRLTRRHFPHRAALLSVTELAALAHLPTDPDAPGLTRAAARSIPPPPSIPPPSSAARPLGHSDAGPRRAIALPTHAARHHLHLMGATGSGKSTLITHLALDDARHRRGLIVVDPKGDLVTELLERLPEDCADRLVLIDPADHRPPPCLNVLEGDDSDMVVDNIAGIFRRIFAAFWGPRTDDLMRASCLTLLRHHHTTGQSVSLADIPRLLAEPAYRLRITPGVNDPLLRGFWTGYDALSEPAKTAVSGPLMNKLRAFLLRDFTRRAIAHGPSTYRLDDVLNGGILLARLPKGTLGEETARLLGSFLVARTWQAATARAHQPEHARVDASLYLDECHNFLNLPYPVEEMLAEARGYRLSLNLAHQHLAQLPTDLREAISTNARNKIFFTASPEDARALERHTQPSLAAHDLAHLARHQAAARLLTDHTDTTSAFTLTTNPAPPPTPGRAHHLRQSANRPPTTETASSPTTRETLT